MFVNRYNVLRERERERERETETEREREREREREERALHSILEYFMNIM